MGLYYRELVKRFSRNTNGCTAIKKTIRKRECPLLSMGNLGHTGRNHKKYEPPNGLYNN